MVFLSVLENSKGEKCFLIWGCKKSFFWLRLDISPLTCQLTNIIHMLLIICEEPRPFLWPLLGLKTPATRLSSKELVQVGECEILSYCSRVKGLQSTVLLSAVFNYLCPLSLNWWRQLRAKYLTLKQGFSTSAVDIWARFFVVGRQDLPKRNTWLKYKIKWEGSEKVLGREKEDFPAQRKRLGCVREWCTQGFG